MASSSIRANDSDLSDINAKRMVNAFRVVELKEFLKSVNVSSGGRKKDLQDRAMMVIDTGNPKIHLALVQLYQKTFPSNTIMGGAVKSPPKPPVSHSTAKPPSFHVKHPDVKFKAHPFYQHHDTVYRPTAMESSSYLKKSMTVQFHLTPQHIRQIFDSESVPGSYSTQVVLRFCKKETSCDQEDFFPGNCFITINNQTCPIPGYNPNFSMRPEYKRNGKPINITTYVHTSPAIVNTLCLTWNRDIIHSQGFCFTIDLMSCLSPTDLLNKLKAKGTRSSSVSKAMIRDKLLIDRDAEISTTSLKISLICPLGKIRISNPCKSTSCDHLQCFDASIYLQMNERKPKWICPVCDRSASFSDLLIDGYLLEICDRTSDTLIEFDTDGSWHPIKKTREKIVELTPTTSITISDSPGRSVKGPPNRVNSSVIDLTADTSDDEYPIDFRPTTTTSTNNTLDNDDSSTDTDSHSDTTNSHSDTVNPHSDTANSHSDTTNPHSDTVNPHSDTATTKSLLITLSNNIIVPSSSSSSHSRFIRDKMESASLLKDRFNLFMKEITAPTESPSGNVFQLLSQTGQDPFKSMLSQGGQNPFKSKTWMGLNTAGSHSNTAETGSHSKTITPRSRSKATRTDNHPYSVKTLSRSNTAGTDSHSNTAETGSHSNTTRPRSRSKATRTDNHPNSVRTESHSNATGTDSCSRTGPHFRTTTTDFNFNAKKTDSHSNTARTESRSNTVRTDSHFNTARTESRSSIDSQRPSVSSLQSPPTRVPVIAKHWSLSSYLPSSSHRKDTPTNQSRPNPQSGNSSHTRNSYSGIVRTSHSLSQQRRSSSSSSSSSTSEWDRTQWLAKNRPDRLGHCTFVRKRKNNESTDTDEFNSLARVRSKRRKGLPSRWDIRGDRDQYNSYQFSPESNTSSQALSSSESSSPSV